MSYLLIFFKYQEEPFLTQILFLNNLLNNNNKKTINIDVCIKPPPSTPPHDMESHIKPSYLPSNPVRLCHNRTRASSPAASVASLPKPTAQRACVTGSLYATFLAEEKIPAGNVTSHTSFFATLTQKSCHVAPSSTQRSVTRIRRQMARVG